MRRHVRRSSAAHGWSFAVVLLLLAACSDATGPERRNKDEQAGGGAAETHGGPGPEVDIGIVDLGLPAGATSGRAVAINNVGTVTGIFTGPGLGPRVFRWNVCTGLVDLGNIGAPFGANDVVLGGINDRGDIVGSLRFPGGSLGFTTRAFILPAGGALRFLEPLPGTTAMGSEAHAINNAGVIVGGAPNASGVMVAVRWDERGVPRVLPRGTVATAINERGEIAGSWDANGFKVFGIYWPTLDEYTTFGLNPDDILGAVTVTDISDNTSPTVVGEVSAWTTSVLEAFSWMAWDPNVRRRFVPLRSASAVDDRGWIVGYGGTTTARRALLWPGSGTPIDLGTLGGAGSEANDIDDRGLIVGTAQTADGTFRPVLWIARPQPGASGVAAAILEEVGSCGR